MFSNIFRKKEASDQDTIYVNVDGKPLSEKGYLAWLENTQSRLRNKLANEILPQKQQPGVTVEKMKQLGRSAVREFIDESKHFESNPNDTDQVKVSKERLSAVIKMIMHECGLSESELLTSPNQNEELIELGEKDIINESVAEISKPSYQQIEIQANSISELAKTYEQQYLEGVLVPMWEKYQQATDQRMKQLLYDEFISAQKGYVDIVDDDLKGIGESEYFVIAAARADLTSLRNKIANYGTSMDEQKDLAA